MGPSVPDTTPPTSRRPRYELLRVVNRGGMGEIALAKAVGTKGFEKLVVLKRLRADAEREDHLAMFDVEQEVMSRLEHPNVVKVFDQPIVDGIPYMAMEYVRGRNLDQVVRAANQAGEALPVQYCLTVISEVLRGLAFVHRLKDTEGRALGVVHQDMTPSNVMVSFFGEVKITDFGISYVTSRDGGLRRGVLKGKPRYVAPEVLAGKRVNNTADIYGVGVVLFEMLTGRALFARPTVKETLSAVARNELPNLADELANQPAGLVKIMQRALSKAPHERYRTAEEMAADVLNEVAKLGGPMPPASLGFLTRKYFNKDPDVPEMDPALERAMSHGSGSRPELEPKDLESTLLELDKLLGKDDSVDLFAVPEDLLSDLRELPDMDPFQAHTPLPDYVWDAESDEEILEKAGIRLNAATSDMVFADSSKSGGLTKKENVPAIDTEELLMGAKTTPRAPASETPPQLEAQAPAPPPTHTRPRPSTPIDLSDDGPTRTLFAPPASAHAHTPSGSLAAGNSSGLWIGFVYGFAVGLAAGAMLYAFLTS